MGKYKNNNEVTDNVCGKFIIKDISHKESVKELPEEKDPNCFHKVVNPDDNAPKNIPAEPFAGKINGILPQIESMFGRYWWLTAIVIVYLLTKKN